MFSYPDFLMRSLEAGLQEITFSVHGDNARVHDALVGVPGAFEQEVEGLRLALADGRPIVNVDVCLNKGNIKRLPKLLERFIELGVREFDLLHLIPFGSAWSEKHRHSLVYDIEEAMPYIEAALRLSERPDLYVWFNRFPPACLEGYESLIQDPYKLTDEARGRFEEYELWLTRGLPLSCREPSRCERCYLEDFCGTLEDTMARISTGAFDAYRVCASIDPSPAPSPVEAPSTWVRAPDLTSAWPLIEASRSEELLLELGSYEGLSERMERDTLAGKRLFQARVSCPRECERLLTGAGQFEVMAALTREMADYLAKSHPNGHARLALTLPNYELATVAGEQDPDLGAFFRSYTPSIPVENVPACLAGRPPRPRLRVLDSSTLRTEAPNYQGHIPGDSGGRGSLLKALTSLSIGDPAKTRKIKDELSRLGPLSAPKTQGALDLFGYTKGYIHDQYYSKSLRCRSCVYEQTCEGLHINHIRAQGYAQLQPIEETAPDCPDGPHRED